MPCSYEGENTKIVKVIHLLGPLMPSGMERMLESASSYFVALGIEVVVVGQGNANPFADNLRAVGYEVREIPWLRTRPGRREWASLLRELRPDVVHLHTEGAWIQTVFTTSRVHRRKPIVRTIHNVFDARGLWGLSRQAKCRLVDPFVASIIACSADVAANERRFGRRPEVILNWVDDRFIDASGHRQTRSSGEDGTPRSAVIVGNCSPIKSHELALEALLEHGIEVFHFGDETHANEVEIALLEGLDSRGLLAYRGQGDPLAALVSADLYVMPSQLEGMSIALAEAVAVGIPTMVNRVPGQTWALDLAGVEGVDNASEAWNGALEKFRRTGSLSNEGSRNPPDLSAARGAQQYFDMYERLTRGA